MLPEASLQRITFLFRYRNEKSACSLRVKEQALDCVAYRIIETNVVAYKLAVRFSASSNKAFLSKVKCAVDNWNVRWIDLECDIARLCHFKRVSKQTEACYVGSACDTEFLQSPRGVMSRRQHNL